MKINLSLILYQVVETEETGTAVIHGGGGMLITSVDGNIATFVKIVNVYTFDSAIPFWPVSYRYIHFTLIFFKVILL